MFEQHHSRKIEIKLLPYYNLHNCVTGSIMDPLNGSTNRDRNNSDRIQIEINQLLKFFCLVKLLIEVEIFDKKKASFMAVIPINFLLGF